MRSYLGLDLSLTATGFFLLYEDGTNKNLEICTKPDRFPSLIKRAKHIADTILEQLQGEDVVLVLLENYFVGKFANSAINLATLGTMVRDRLLARGLKYIAVQATTIKKYESGCGTAKKGLMVKHVYQNHHFDTPSDNIADACAMAYLCKGYVEWLAGRKPEFKYQVEVLKKLSSTCAVETPY